MSELSIAALIVGFLSIGLHLPGLLAPDLVRQALQAFPRNMWAAVVLTAVDLVWVALLILDTDLGSFEHLKPAVYVLGPLSFFLLNKYLDELLAPRALGGLLLLIASPVLTVARWHESPLRLLMTVIAYIWVIKGIILVLSPYRFRTMAEVILRDNNRLRASAITGLVLGFGLIVLAVTVYKKAGGS
ncbi:MAG: hypothetical protein AAF492_32965 [Verrucomicrobiota bacterium]